MSHVNVALMSPHGQQFLIRTFSQMVARFNPQGYIALSKAHQSIILTVMERADSQIVCCSLTTERGPFKVVRGAFSMIIEAKRGAHPAQRFREFTSLRSEFGPKKSTIERMQSQLVVAALYKLEMVSGRSSYIVR